MAAGTPQKNDLVVKETEDGGWTVLQDGEERMPHGSGIHLTDRDRAEETADDIGSYEKVDIWVMDRGQYSLLRSYRDSSAAR